jgi:hypothetical protein
MSLTTLTTTTMKKTTEQAPFHFQQHLQESAKLKEKLQVRRLPREETESNQRS